MNVRDQLEPWIQVFAGINQETRMRILHNFALSQARLLHLLAKYSLYEFREYLGRDGSIVNGAFHRYFHPDTLEHCIPPKRNVETCKQHIKEMAKITDSLLCGSSDDFFSSTRNWQTTELHIWALFLLGMILLFTKLRPLRYLQIICMGLNSK